MVDAPGPLDEPGRGSSLVLANQAYTAQPFLWPVYEKSDEHFSNLANYSGRRRREGRASRRPIRGRNEAAAFADGRHKPPARSHRAAFGSYFMASACMTIDEQYGVITHAVAGEIVWDDLTRCNRRILRVDFDKFNNVGYWLECDEAEMERHWRRAFSLGNFAAEGRVMQKPPFRKNGFIDEDYSQSTTSASPA